jgi:hypothetical protein
LSRQVPRRDSPVAATIARSRRSSHKTLDLDICIKMKPRSISLPVDVDLKEATPMDRRNIETVGVRRTGWAALDRDPQEDRVEFACPHCGTRGQKNARRERTQYHFTDGFLQDLQGEVTQCRACGQSLRVVPVVMLHDQDEKRRFEAVFSDEIPVNSHTL